MYVAPAREGRVTIVITARIHRAVWACVDPALHRSALLGVPPQAHEGMTLRIIGPRAPREASCPSGGLEEYLSPISPRSLG
jgi:hypothetical protein